MSVNLSTLSSASLQKIVGWSDQNPDTALGDYNVHEV